MAMPTPEQVENMMREKMGGAIPKPFEVAKEIDPNFLVEHALSAKFSMESENNPFDKKTSMMIALGASLALGSKCTKAQIKMLKNMGLTKEELAFIVKIVKHANASSLMGQAQDMFEEFLK